MLTGRSRPCMLWLVTSIAGEFLTCLVVSEALPLDMIVCFQQRPKNKNKKLTHHPQHIVLSTEGAVCHITIIIITITTSP